MAECGAGGLRSGISFSAMHGNAGRWAMLDGSGDWQGRRVLVTGASGFIGTALCRRLAALGAEVHGSTRGDAVEHLARSARPEIVFHLSGAAIGTRDMAAVMPTLRDNLLSTVHLLLGTSALGIDRLVLAGSVEARPEPDASPRSPYAASKAMAAAYVRMFGTLYQTCCVDIRIAMGYGPGQRDPTKLVPYVINEVRAGRAPLLSNGSRLADWTYIDDIVSALLAAATSPDAVGQSIEIGTGVTSSVREVVERIVDLVDPSVVPRFGALESRPFELQQAVDTEPAMRLLGWRPSVTLDEGIRRTVELALRDAPAGTSPVRVGSRTAL
jgi:UDP-glucose 4-epimerase